MNAPIIWIGFPGLLAVYLWITKVHERRTLFTGLGASLFFIITGSLIPIGKPVFQIGETTLQISPSLELLGRRFTLGNGDQVFVSLVFLILFLFLSMSFVVDIPIRFVPIGFMLASLFLAALSVQPFLFAALILEICVILSVVLVSKFGVMPTTGVIRFLVFQSLAMPFMLASGWVLSAVEANPTETRLIIQSLILIGLGFSFWLGVFPFNSWMPQLSAEKPPFIVGFVLLLFNTATLILVIRYLDGFVWLRDDARIFIVLRFMGIVMLSSSALQFLVEKNIFKTTAFIVSYETGLSLIALSLNQVNGWNSFVLMFIPRILSIVLWVLLLTYIQQSSNSDETEGTKKIDRWILPGFALSVFSVAGFPLLPGFITRITIFSNLVKDDLPGLVWISGATVVFLIASIRFLWRVRMDFPIGNDTEMNRIEKSYFLFLYSCMILTGLLPQFVLRGLLSMLQSFPNLK